jgi:hypothetical protein
MLNRRQQMDFNAMSENQRNSSYYFLCGNYIHNTVQPTMYFAVRTAAAAAAAAASTATSTTPHKSKNATDSSVSNGTSLGPLPKLPFHDFRDSEDANDSGGMDQEPALINAMNGMLRYRQIRTLFINLKKFSLKFVCLFILMCLHICDLDVRIFNGCTNSITAYETTLVESFG